MAIIRYEDLSQIRETHRNQKIVYCSGTFDLTHAGHILFFEDCKKLGDILVVSVGSDYDIGVNKGTGRPILNEHIRLFTISRLKPVDYCFIGRKMRDNNNPLESMAEIFQDLKPDIYIINEDAFDILTRRKLAAENNVPLVVLQRHCPPKFDNISTTKLIQKIKQLPELNQKENL